jgi:tetratricopeptide (TPR) repeat protein
LLGTAFGFAGDQKKCTECLEKALEIALDKGYMDIALSSYNNLSQLLPDEEFERRFELLKKGFELAKKAGDTSRQSWLAEGLAQLYMGRGDVNKAVVLIEESIALDRKSGNAFHLPMSLGLLSSIRLILGDLEEAEQYAREAFDISQKQKHFQSVAGSNWHLGRLAFDRGEYVKAMGFFESGYKACEKAGPKSSIIWFSLWVIRTHIELREFAEAQNKLESLQKLALDVKDKVHIADVDVLKATLFRTQKKWQNSLALFEKSIQEFDALNARHWRVYDFARWVLCEYARTYLERDEVGDREKAQELLSQALEMFQKIGAKRDVEKTMKLSEVLQPPKIQTSEKRVSTAGVVCDDVRSSVIATPRELKVGESLELDIEVTNTRKRGTILLTKIMEVIPEGFAIAKKPELYCVEDNCLIIREKRLGPSRTELVKLVLEPKAQGTFQIKPKIAYLDENGKEKIYEPKPVSITVKELGLRGWLKGER